LLTILNQYTGYIRNV